VRPTLVCEAEAKEPKANSMIRRAYHSIMSDGFGGAAPVFALDSSPDQLPIIPRYGTRLSDWSLCRIHGRETVQDLRKRADHRSRPTHLLLRRLSPPCPRSLLPAHTDLIRRSASHAFGLEFYAHRLTGSSRPLGFPILAVALRGKPAASRPLPS
jgi:hypothetical protein